MATNFFWIGYHFEEFRSQEAIRKKKLISRPAMYAFSKELIVFVYDSANFHMEDI